MGELEAALELALERLDPELVDIRRDLHAHPEPSWEETRTTEVLTSCLREAGLAPEPVATPTGLSCDVGTGDGLVALRADIDALRLSDLKEVPYRSTVPGVCHACGHDVHAAAADDPRGAVGGQAVPHLAALRSARVVHAQRLAARERDLPRGHGEVVTRAVTRHEHLP